jgi:hypothetical protein
METRKTQTIERQPFDGPSANAFTDSDEYTTGRLNLILAANAEIRREKSWYACEREKLESELIKNPLSSEKSFAYFGLMLGALTPASIFVRVLLESGSFRSKEIWIVGVMAIVNLISAMMGFFSGKLIGKIVRETEKLAWWKMLLLLPFIGILWGIMAGGAGGIIIFVFGAIFGAALGALVGSLALPFFTVFHRLLKRGDLIERDQFIPVALGTTLVVCGFILGF